jgi:medium-chain acyl-[acyl-carrier-protein] hydrolase
MSADAITRIRWPQSAEKAAFRLVCIPCAGGDARMFADWQRQLGAGVAIGLAELPGRGSHFSMPALRTIEDAVVWLLTALERLDGQQFGLFGHSMGALIAYEIAHALRARKASMPLILMVAAHRAPHLPGDRPPIHELPDCEFIKRVAELDGLPAELLANPELVELLTPRLRADFEACETYVPRDYPPLDLPLTAYGGTADPDVSTDDLVAWRAHTRGPFRMVMLPGTHFFIERSRNALMRDIATRLAELTPFHSSNG